LIETEFWSRLTLDIQGTGTEYDGLKLGNKFLHLTDPDLPAMEMNAEDVAQFIQLFRDVLDRAGFDHAIKSHEVDYPILNYNLCNAVCPFGEMSLAAKKFLCIWNGWICHFDFTQDEAPLSDEENS